MNHLQQGLRLPEWQSCHGNLMSTMRQTFGENACDQLGQTVGLLIESRPHLSSNKLLY